MDSISPRYQENPNPSLFPSPHSLSSSSCCCSSSNSNGAQPQQVPSPPTPAPAPAPAPPPPQPPKLITRSESGNPYPTTFVQADTSTFKQVVQMLTGSSDTARQVASKHNNPNTHPSLKTQIPPIKSMPKNQQSGFKLYERRNSLKNLKINPLIPVFSSNNSVFSLRKPEILSPSILDFPALVLSPVTPLIPDPFDRSAAARYSCADNNGSPTLDSEAEEKAIKEKEFFLHASQASTPRDTEPRLLPLFPTTSPRASDGGERKQLL